MAMIEYETNAGQGNCPTHGGATSPRASLRLRISPRVAGAETRFA